MGLADRPPLLLPPLMTYQLNIGSNLDVLPSLPDNSVDAIVTDPPYELGFMGKSWDASGIAYNVELWRHCLRVLKPGGHLLAFSGSRTYHRMTCAIEDAGFEVRDQIMWVYGSGFPKSLNVAKAIDAQVRCGGSSSRKLRQTEQETGGASYQLSGVNNGILGEKKVFERKVWQATTDEAKKWDGWGTALKPAHEPICVARKPLDGTVAVNVLKWGTGALNINQSRVCVECGNDDANDFLDVCFDCAEKPQGRWPANLIHDGSQEVLELFPGNAGAAAPVSSGHSGDSKNGIYGDYAQRGDDGATFYGDKGSAARFFYCPKASKADRDDGCEGFEERSRPTMGSGIGGQPDQQLKNNRNIHPTVKPTELMAYLCRLVTPPGGTILDPFTGSGSTGRGAVSQGFNFIGIELSPEYAAIAEARIKAAIK